MAQPGGLNSPGLLVNRIDAECRPLRSATSKAPIFSDFRDRDYEERGHGATSLRYPRGLKLPVRELSSGLLASTSDFLCRGLGSRWLAEGFHRNTLVTHIKDGQVFCTAR